MKRFLALILAIVMLASVGCAVAEGTISMAFTSLDLITRRWVQMIRQSTLTSSLLCLI